MSPATALAPSQGRQMWISGHPHAICCGCHSSSPLHVPTTVTSGPAAASRRGHVLASPHSARTPADALSSAVTPRPGPPHPARPGPSNPPARATAKGVLRTGGQARHPMTEPRASPPPSQQGSVPPSLLHLCMAATGYMRRLENRNNDNGLQKPNFQKSMHSYGYLRKKQNR